MLTEDLHIKLLNFLSLINKEITYHRKLLNSSVPFTLYSTYIKKKYVPHNYQYRYPANSFRISWMRVRTSLFYRTCEAREGSSALLYEYKGRSILFHGKIYHLLLREGLFRATMRSWNRVGVVATPQRYRYSDSPMVKLVTEKCDKARNLVKLSAGPGPSERASERVSRRCSRYTCIQILEKYPGISRREGTSWQHVLGIELLSMPMQLQRRLSLRTCRCNARVHTREIFIPCCSTLKNIASSVSSRTRLHILRVPKFKNVKFFSVKISLTKKDTSWK